MASTTTTSWSAENATRAYLRTLKMGGKDKEPDSSEFIAAMAGGNNAQLMVVASGVVPARSTILALAAAAHQTGGRVICIFPGHDDLHGSINALGLLPYSNCIEFVVGDARAMLLNEYKGADFVVVDCKMEDHKSVLLASRRSANKNGCLVVGYNAIHCGPWWFNNGMKVHFLPIGKGIMVSRISPAKSHWIVEVDKCTGEEHVYRITSPRVKQIIQV